MFLTSPRHPRIYNLPEAADEIWHELDEARRQVDAFARALRWATRSIDSPLESPVLGETLTPLRCLVLAHIGRRSALGITPTLLARELGIARPLLDYHLDVLEENGMVERESGVRYDRRKVVVRLQWKGGEALALSARVLARCATHREPDASGSGELAP